MEQFLFLKEQNYSEEGKKLLSDLNSGKYYEVLKSDAAVSLLQADIEEGAGKSHIWNERLVQNVGRARERENGASTVLLVGLAALQAFLQSNVTGPPLSWDPEGICVPQTAKSGESWENLRSDLLSSLSVDGEAAYHLIPNIELFCLARILLNQTEVYATNDLSIWARLRVNFWHQKLLDQVAPSLQKLIYGDLDLLGALLSDDSRKFDNQLKALFWLESASVHMLHNDDDDARNDLEKAAKFRKFEFILTGMMGKRTKFQQKETSQLVVLAKSFDSNEDTTNGISAPDSGTKEKPKNFDLNDDTLLESISFSKSPVVRDESEMPASLANLDPSNQPILHPLDSTLLLSLASSITNTSPDHGLTREQTLPYATRVLEGGSSNWQVYTQALLVRSRVEGFSSRTVERGALQLQALVDQVIADTSAPSDSTNKEVTTFLPRPEGKDSAPANERLQYIFQLASPPRWALEAELAQRWASLGALRTSLEIYERLEMWPEAALCWAALGREDKAISIVKKQLYQTEPAPASGDEEAPLKFTQNELERLPVDAPRLFCILGDIEQSAQCYERAWEVSGQRYSRAQRSLGKLYLSKGDMKKAEEAYSKSLVLHPQNAGVWFSLGCVRLSIEDWDGASKAFSRAVQLEPEDAEAWSNLAAALMRLPPKTSQTDLTGEEEDGERTAKSDPDKHKREALVAFKRASQIKRDSYRIWQNLLNLAATIAPPPYADIIVAQQRIIDLRGKTEGESCVDVEIMEGILSHIITVNPRQTRPLHSDEPASGEDAPGQSKHGIEHMFSELVMKRIVPLITRSRRLWQLVARLCVHLGKPSSALDATEKAWRITLNQPGWDDGTAAPGVATARSARDPWEDVVEATIELVDAYESLGQREVTEGLGAGSGELVCKNWKFKARTAIRSVTGRRSKAGLEPSKILDERMEDLKGGSSS